MKCLIPGCEREGMCRGMCTNCYQLANKRVKQKRVTWKELIEVGLAKEATHSCQGGVFATALKEAFPNSENKEMA